MNRISLLCILVGRPQAQVSLGLRGHVSRPTHLKTELEGIQSSRLTSQVYYFGHNFLKMSSLPLVDLGDDLEPMRRATSKLSDPSCRG